ncbi:MAG: sugar phosphate isomerase/epimerase family protein [Candidatus Acidiferrales bacterium]
MSEQFNRRQFLATSAAAAIALLPVDATAGASNAPQARRKFYSNLAIGLLGPFHQTLPETMELAIKYGFEGIDPNAEYFGSLSDDDLKRLQEKMEANHLKFGAAGLPVDFRRDEASFSDSLKKFPATADSLKRAGVARVSTWFAPASNELTYLQNFRQHAYRMRECALILADRGQRLGFEYVAPRSSRMRGKQPFIHCMAEMKELIAAIGTDNVGFRLDSWHWFNAEETARDILSLRGSDVVTVDLNDAPVGLTLDQYNDGQRELPAATGVIPVKSFLDALAQIGYDGPIQAEPNNVNLRSTPMDQALTETSAAMKRAFGEI